MVADKRFMHTNLRGPGHVTAILEAENWQKMHKFYSIYVYR